MKTQPLESNIMLAGLTRGLWTGASADRHVEHRATWTSAVGGSRPLHSDAGIPGIAGEDRATGSVVAPKEIRHGHSES